MTLREYLLAHPEPILAEWVRFARSLGVGAGMTRLSLLNHSAQLLVAVAGDMAERQDAAQRAAKSEGKADDTRRPSSIEGVSKYHAESRVDSGFDLVQVISEYRALRSSVVDLWRRSEPGKHDDDLDEVGRFNEAIDQAVAVAVKAFTTRVRRSGDLFLATLGHDMRGPLHAISMLAHVAATESGDKAGLGKSTAQIVATVEAAAGLLDDLLLFTSTRLGAGLPLSRADLDVAALCDKVIAEVGAAQPSAKIKRERRGSGGDNPGAFVGEFDEGRLRQAIANLVRNAAQHGSAGGDVVVSLRRGPTTLTLAVHNFGRPIPPDLLPTIFEPMVRDHAPNATAARRAGSVGLGLYIVREVIAAHGGTVRVESTAAAGTTFTAELPLRAPTEVAPATAA